MRYRRTKSAICKVFLPLDKNETGYNDNKMTFIMVPLRLSSKICLFLNLVFPIKKLSCASHIGVANRKLNLWPHWSSFFMTSSFYQGGKKMGKQYSEWFAPSRPPMHFVTNIARSF